MAEDPRVEPSEETGAEPELLSRREYLIGLRKWSAAVIGGALLGTVLAQNEARAGAWVNRRGGWINGGGGWVNAVGGGGGAWVNGSGGGGGAWVNGRGYGGAGWINR
jgi:hypothetical protein